MISSAATALSSLASVTRRVPVVTFPAPAMARTAVSSAPIASLMIWTCSPPASWSVDRTEPSDPGSRVMLSAMASPPSCACAQRGSEEA